MLPCSVTAIAGIFSFDRLIEQLVDPARAVEQRILGVKMKVDELGMTERNAEDADCREIHPRSHVLSSAFRHSHSMVDGGFELMS